MATKPRKLYGDPVTRVLSRSDGVVVGYLYRWNTGEHQIMWCQVELPVQDIMLEDELTAELPGS